jgi:hypothetical protein
MNGVGVHMFTSCPETIREFVPECEHVNTDPNGYGMMIPPPVCFSSGAAGLSID